MASRIQISNWDWVGGQKYAPWVGAAHGRELAAWAEFDMFRPVPQETIKEAIVDTRWASTREIVGGKTAVKARLGVNGFQIIIEEWEVYAVALDFESARQNLLWAIGRYPYLFVFWLTVARADNLELKWPQMWLPFRCFGAEARCSVSMQTLDCEMLRALSGGARGMAVFVAAFLPSGVVVP